MPRPLREESTALRKLKGMLQGNTEPVLTEDEILDLLQDHQVARVWTPGLVVQIGDVIVPTVPTGWMYRVDPGRDADGVAGGITGATEPKWPLDPRWPSWEPGSVTDGTLRFMIFRAEIPGLWDLQAAAYSGWTMKAAKATELTDFTADRIASVDSQVYEHCMAMARQHAPLRIS